MPKFKFKKWHELFPNGRYIFYEGENPLDFAAEIKQKFGFDPSKNNPNWNRTSGYGFFCPPKFLETIYTKYQMGS